MFKRNNIVEGVLVCNIPYRCWDLYMDGYSDIIIPKGHKVKVHFCNNVAIKINAMKKEILSGGYIYLDPKQYLQYIKINKEGVDFNG